MVTTTIAYRCAAATLPLSLALIGLTAGRPASVTAATIDPLPAAATALSHITSYEVTIQAARPPQGTRPRPPRSGTGTRRGGTGRFFAGGRGGSQTLIVVRKNGTAEDYFVLKGTSVSGKSVTTEIVMSGGRVCQRVNGAKSFTCQSTAQSGGAATFLSDPTIAFTQGAGATIFTTTSGKTINGEHCDGFSYSNVAARASGTIYLSSTSHLPYEQVATVTRSGFNGGPRFTIKITYIWSHYNDSHLVIPAVPAA